MNKHLFTPSSKLAKTNHERKNSVRKPSQIVQKGGFNIENRRYTNVNLIQKYFKYKDKYQQIVQMGGKLR